MKEKVYLIETARRAWLMNIINFYGLLFILPYYLLSRFDIRLMLVYMIFMASAGVFLAVKLSILLTKKFRKQLSLDMLKRNILRIAYGAFYGFSIPLVSLVFIPILITITLTINVIEASLAIKLFIVFIVDYVLVFIFAYKNIKIVNSKINEILECLRYGG